MTKGGPGSWPFFEFNNEKINHSVYIKMTTIIEREIKLRIKNVVHIYHIIIYLLFNP